MTTLIQDRVCADTEGETVVFLIGMRINKYWKIWKWLPVAMAMPPMLRELAQHPELGLRHARLVLGLRNLWSVQYWHSAAHLQAYAQTSNHAHLPAWQAFNAKIGTTGDVGIWHETYVVPPGHAESIYVNMPRFGWGMASTLFPAKGKRASAAKRLNLTAHEPQDGNE